MILYINDGEGKTHYYFKTKKADMWEEALEKLNIKAKVEENTG